MIGVVIWSDPKDRKAVFWCEDHGDLAFFDQNSELTSADGFFEAGDMVQFDIVVQNKFRKARNPQLLHEGAWDGLPDRLVAHETIQPSDTRAKVVPFPARAPAEPIIIRRKKA